MPHTQRPDPGPAKPAPHDPPPTIIVDSDGVATPEYLEQAEELDDQQPDHALGDGARKM